VSLLGIDYREAIADPRQVAAQLNQFFQGKLDEAGMIAAIDPSLRHEDSVALNNQGDRPPQTDL
jgi:hypothetical protein